MTDEQVTSIIRDDLRRLALDVQRAHDPAQQEHTYANRCAVCQFTRWPCDPYELATGALTLLDLSRDGRMESDAD